MFAFQGKRQFDIGRKAEINSLWTELLRQGRFATSGAGWRDGAHEGVSQAALPGTCSLGGEGDCIEPASPQLVGVAARGKLASQTTLTVIAVGELVIRAGGRGQIRHCRVDQRGAPIRVWSLLPATGIRHGSSPHGGVSVTIEGPFS